MLWIRRAVQVSLCGVLLCAALSAKTRASEWDKKTIVTFNEPVEIPGQVLPPGTYVFKLAPTISDRHIVQIWSGDQSYVIATILTIPIYRAEPPDNTLMLLEEHRGQSAMALHAWFFPGDDIGNQFLYPER